MLIFKKIRERVVEKLATSTLLLQADIILCLLSGWIITSGLRKHLMRIVGSRNLQVA